MFTSFEFINVSIFVKYFLKTKYATKAFKMNVAQIKVLCFFFSVPIVDDDGKTLIKEDLIGAF